MCVQFVVRLGGVKLNCLVDFLRMTGCPVTQKDSDREEVVQKIEKFQQLISVSACMQRLTTASRQW